MSGAGCHCDTQCYQIGDCCSDYNLQCVHPITTTTPATAVINTCAGRCSSGQSRSLVRAPSSSKCYCDPGCVSVGDCCPDYPQQCQKTTTTTTPTPSGSCVGKCANSLFRLSVRQGEDKRTTTEIFCGAEQHVVGLHSHILKILDLCCEAAETQLEYAEISKYFRQIKCQNSRYNSMFAFTFKKV